MNTRREQQAAALSFTMKPARPQLQTGLFCYWLNPVQTADGSYQPCIVVANEAGYYRMDYTWKADLNTCEQLIRQKNDELGVSIQQASAIVGSSMFYPNAHYTPPIQGTEGGE